MENKGECEICGKLCAFTDADCLDTYYDDDYDDEGDDYESDCSYCEGSGEGGHESLRCEMCKGTGIGRSFPEEYEDNYSEENYDTI